MEPKRLIVAGSRHLNREDHYSTVADAIWKWEKEHNDNFPTQIVSGCCKGADAIGEFFTRVHLRGLRKYPAQWEKFGRSAGPMRNQKMVDESDGLVVVRFANSVGSADVLERAKKKGIPIVDIIVTLCACLFLLGGCSNPSYCQAHTEAERAIVAYQDDFGGTVTPVQAACVHQFALHFPGKHTEENVCGHGNVGCTKPSSDPRAPSPIYVRRFQPGHDTELGTLRHELTHLVLYCATGDGHPDHDVPEFNFHDGPTDEPGTLMWWMARTEVMYDCGAP